MPSCPKCGEWISNGHYERHLQRCGTVRQAPGSLQASSATAHGQSPERGTIYGTPSTERGGIDWRKVGAAFLIFLLIGSVVVFFVLYALSLL